MRGSIAKKLKRIAKVVPGLEYWALKRQWKKMSEPEKQALTRKFT